MSVNQHSKSPNSIELLDQEFPEQRIQVQQIEISPNSSPSEGAVVRVEQVEANDEKSNQTETTRIPVLGGSRANSSILNTKFLLLMVLLSTTMFAFILWYVETFSAPTAIRTGQAMHRVLKVDIGSALAVLRVTQGILSTVTTLGLMKALEMLQWGLAGRVHGLRSNVFLALSPTTPISEVFCIVISRMSSWAARAWGLIR